VNDSLNNNDNKIVPIFNHHSFFRKAEARVDDELTSALLSIISSEESNDIKKLKPNNAIQLNIQDEANFKSRFGFSLGKKGREALFDLMKRNDLSDEDLKSIKRIGYVSWNGNSLKVGIDKLTVFFGFFLLTLFTIFAFTAALVLIFKPETSINITAQLSLIYLFLVLVLTWISKLYLKPYQIIQERYQVINKKLYFLNKLHHRLTCNLE